MAIDVYKWAPTRPIVNIPGLRRFSPRRTLKNFGDEIGPVVVEGLARTLGLPPAMESTATGRLLSVGSILHFARSGDTIWGSGINGKERDPVLVQPGMVTLEAVRGPRTHKMLSDRGFTVPKVFGDPALLLRYVDARYANVDQTTRRRVTLLPNLNDAARYRSHPAYVSPLQDPLRIAEVIASSEIVVGSSLHAIVIADMYGVPVRRMTSLRETEFKYADYYEGTDRELPDAANSVADALSMGASEELRFTPDLLIQAFPQALFTRESGVTDESSSPPS